MGAAALTALSRSLLVVVSFLLCLSVRVSVTLDVVRPHDDVDRPPHESYYTGGVRDGVGYGGPNGSDDDTAGSGDYGDSIAITPLNTTRLASPTVRPDYLSHLRTLPAFPRTLHVLFPVRDYYVEHPEDPFVKNSMGGSSRRIPTGTSVWDDGDDGDMDGIIRRGTEEGIISREELEVLVGNGMGGTAAHPVERSGEFMWAQLFTLFGVMLGGKTRA